MNDQCTKLVYLPARWGETWQPFTCSDGDRSCTSNGTGIPNDSSSSGSRTGSCQTPPFGETSKLSEEESSRLIGSWLKSIQPSLLPVSRASRGPQEEKVAARTMTATSGRKPFALLEKSGPRGFSWKTLQGCFKFPGDGTGPPTFSKSRETWPSWGMWDAGAAYLRPTSVSITNGDGCGLLPTPLARDGKSFYVVTKETALRIMRKRPLHQLHWMQFGVVYHGLKKGWANPRFSELMMGWPIGWSDLRPLAKDRFRQWLKQPGGY